MCVNKEKFQSLVVITKAKEEEYSMCDSLF